MVSSLSLISLPDVSEDYDGGFPDEIKQEISLSRQLLTGFAICTLALHSDNVHLRKMCSFTALGLSEHKAVGTNSLLDPHDLALLKKVVEQRKERMVLAGEPT